MIKGKILFIIMFLSNTSASTFKELVDRLENHNEVQAVFNNAKSISQMGGVNGSWGDPMFRIIAKNIPKDSLKLDETPMSGIEFGISQKIPLSTKYGNIDKSYESLAQAMNYNGEKKKEFLIKQLWEIVITQKSLKDERTILSENISWISKILNVSKKLYTNGKISQQALLDIQIRKSEIEGELSNNEFEISKIDDRLIYLYAEENDKLDFSSVPWGILNNSINKKSNLKDFNQLALENKVQSKEYELKSSKQNYIPDITVSFGYTKRSDLDGKGDFIGAGISFPLPFSGKKYSFNDKIVNEKYSVMKDLENYKKKKRRDSTILSKEVLKIDAELSILNNKTIRFAKSSRTITSKSYGLGNTSYVELLQSELTLQKLLLKKVILESNRNIKKITLKYILGDTLYE